MAAIKDILTRYQGKIDRLDIELIIAHEIGKTREFVLAHPEYIIPATHNSQLATLIKRRLKQEPLAYILGQKEFFGLNFKVNKAVLIPRPETEMLVELALHELTRLDSQRRCVDARRATNNRPASTQRGKQPTTILDLGTGSGNIIISLAHNIKHGTWNNMRFFGIDISNKALTMAKRNAKFHKVDKQIKFLKGNLLEPILKKCFMFHAPCSMIILANLPYLSKEIYNSTPKSVRKFEPKSALFSPQNGLGHYAKLLKQLNKLKSGCSMFHACLSGRQVSCFMEISPEQKPALENLAASILPGARLEFIKDLAGKWRVCKIVL